MTSDKVCEERDLNPLRRVSSDGDAQESLRFDAEQPSSGRASMGESATRVAVPGLPGYSVTRGGDLYTTHSAGAAALVTGGALDRDGYRRVNVYCGGKWVRRYVHRLVAITFHGPQPFKSAEVRHLDGNPTNNAATNLKWGTALENAADRVAHGNAPKGEKNGRALLTEEQVREIRARAAAGEWVRRIAASYPISADTVRGIVCRRSWKHVA